jgi:hypothetical protein
MHSAAPAPIVIAEILRHPDGGLRTLLWEGGEPRWQEPESELKHAEDHGIVFPAVMPDFTRSTPKLVESLSACFARVGILAKDAILAAHFLRCTWVPELLHSFPTLVVVTDSPEFLPSALRTFSRLARRPIVVAYQKPAALLGLPYELCPTLIIEGTHAAASLKRWLSGANVRGVNQFVAGRRCDPSGARIVFAAEPIPAFAAITVTLQQPRAAVDESTLGELQAALLGYGMRTRQQFSRLLPPPTSPELPLACRILQSCCWDDSALHDELAAHFADYVDFSASSARAELRCLVLEGLDTALQEGDARITAGDLAQHANVLADARGEEARITARSVGDCLRQLGFRLAHTNRGNALILDSRAKEKISQLMQRYLSSGTALKKASSAQRSNTPSELVKM